MRQAYVGVEFNHSEEKPQVSIMVTTRAGKARKWATSLKPCVVNGLLRERVVLVMPFGFRFRRDMISDTLRKHKTFTWADAKFYVAKSLALGVYKPYEVKTEEPKPGPGETLEHTEPKEQEVPQTS